MGNFCDNIQHEETMKCTHHKGGKKRNFISKTPSCTFFVKTASATHRCDMIKKMLSFDADSYFSVVQVRKIRT